jgi:hypothetical protein
MSEPAALEQGYRRLLAWYPVRFRSEQGEEMLAVLMAGAQPGQRRPGLMESMDVLRSALGMRLRLVSAGLRNHEWVDALALFSVAAPLFLLVADILEVAVPYRTQVRAGFPFLLRVFGRHPEVGGLSLLRVTFFDIAVGCQVLIAVLVLLGLRWVALAVIAGAVGYLAVASQWIDWIPRPLQLLTAAAYLLTAAALFGSADPRRGRTLLTWGHGVVLLLAAGAVQASTLQYDATTGITRFLSPGPRDTTVYFVISAVLAVAALIVAVILRLNRYFLLLLAVMFYPYVMQLAYPAGSTSDDLLGHPTPSHLTLLFLPPVLVAVVAVLTAIARRGVPLPSEPDQPGVA